MATHTLPYTISHPFLDKTSICYMTLFSETVQKEQFCVWCKSLYLFTYRSFISLPTVPPSSPSAVIALLLITFATGNQSVRFYNGQQTFNYSNISQIVFLKPYYIWSHFYHIKLIGLFILQYVL